MIDYFIKQGGVEGYKIEPVYADAQSKPDVAINEAMRLIEQEKVDMVLGFYASAECVPAAARVEQLKKFMWITTCISQRGAGETGTCTMSSGRRPAATLYGKQATDFIANYAKEKFGKDPKDLRVAIIHEDGSYGVDVAKGDEAGAKKQGFHIVLNEGYSISAPDLSALVTKLKRAKPDVHLPYRLQSRHHAAAAPGARAGAEVRRDGRPGRGLRRLREAEGEPGRRRQLHLQHRSDLDLADQSQERSIPSCRR